LRRPGVFDLEPIHPVQGTARLKTAVASPGLIWRLGAVQNNKPERSCAARAGAAGRFPDNMHFG
jgi:hypothetical protein